MSQHKTIPKKIRLEVYEKFGHRCAYCGCDLAYKDMQVDHLQSVYVHTDLHQSMAEEEMYSVENLKPSILILIAAFKSLSQTIPHSEH